MKTLYSFLISILLILTACSKDEPKTPEFPSQEEFESLVNKSFQQVSMKEVFENGEEVPPVHEGSLGASMFYCYIDFLSSSYARSCSGLPLKWKYFQGAYNPHTGAFGKDEDLRPAFYIEKIEDGKLYLKFYSAIFEATDETETEYREIPYYIHAVYEEVDPSIYDDLLILE